MIKDFISNFASPKTYLEQCNKFNRYFLLIGAFLILIGWIWGLFFAPADIKQGDAYRIIYVHVPSAIYSQLIYWVMAFWAIIYLVWRVRLASYLIKSASYVGLLMTFIALFSGSIWGIPTWGTWWQWDARITSTLILFIMYLGLITLHDSFRNYEKADKLMSILVVVGCINLPIIKWSVEWWATLHQPASDSSNIHPDMLLPLIFSLVGFAFLLISFGMKASKLVILKRERYKQWVVDYD